MRRLVILGSTGSIGTQTLDIVRQHPDRLQVVGLAAQTRGELLKQQAAEFGVQHLALKSHEAAKKHDLAGGIEALEALAQLPEADMVVLSVAGVIGLRPTIKAIEAGKKIALASKEVLVAAGEVVMPLIDKHQVDLLPIDSEHSAIFQCLQGGSTDGRANPSLAQNRGKQSVDELILTASGGPFRGWKAEQLEKVTVEQALNHPTWRMGGKITIDSATLMNKGLEVIEAKWLFGLDIEQVKVVVHPQSVIHSLVKFKDGSVLAQMGWPNMRLPIQYALLFPERVENELKPWSPADSPNLSFEKVDEHAFPSIKIARQSCKAGGTMPCVMNAANEEAANALLRKEIKFSQIPGVVEKTLEQHNRMEATLESLLEADEWARRTSRALMELR